MWNESFFSAPQLKRDPLGCASTMSTFQVTALIAIAVATAIYVWRGVQRASRTEARFFQALVAQLSRLLEPKGFRLTRNVAQASGLRIATFTSHAAVVDAVWEAREREISLVRRGSATSALATADTVARAHVPDGASAHSYAAATDIILGAAESLESAA